MYYLVRLINVQFWFCLKEFFFGSVYTTGLPYQNVLIRCVFPLLSHHQAWFILTTITNCYIREVC